MVQFECTRHRNPPLTLRLSEFHFPIFRPPLSGVIRIGHQYKSGINEKTSEQNWLNRLHAKWSSLNVTGTEIPSHIQVVRIPFSHFQPSSLWGNKNWPPVYRDRLKSMHILLSRTQPEPCRTGKQEQ